MATEFSWSVSRHDSFARCRRRYFYSYYAANEDPEIQRLKKLSALPMWAGSVVHETIEAVLKSRDVMPSPDEQEALIRAAVHGQMLTDWRESEVGSLRFRLFEHEYQVPVEPDDKKIVVGTVMRSLRNFFKSPILAEAFAAASNSETVLRGSAWLAAYSAGLGAAFLLVAVFFVRGMAFFRWMRDHYRVFSIVGGAILVALGLLLFFDEFYRVQVYTHRLLEWLGLGDL